MKLLLLLVVLFTIKNLNEVEGVEYIDFEGQRYHKVETVNENFESKLNLKKPINYYAEYSDLGRSKYSNWHRKLLHLIHKFL